MEFQVIPDYEENKTRMIGEYTMTNMEQYKRPVKHVIDISTSIMTELMVLHQSVWRRRTTLQKWFFLLQKILMHSVRQRVR